VSEVTTGNPTGTRRDAMGAAEATPGRCPVTVLILTYNEEAHIGRAIANVREWAEAVFVLDSHSGDRTREIAQAAGASVHTHAFESFSRQRQWALDNLPFETDWIFILDADELLSDELKEEIPLRLSAAAPDVAAFAVRPRLYWLGRWLRHGGLYPAWLTRLVRRGQVAYGERSVNEHIQADGRTERLDHDLLHVELRTISDWLEKHNRYATLEARELILVEKGETARAPARWRGGTQAEKKQWIRVHVWTPLLPSLLRPFAYFFYVYFVRMGFRDGVPGLTYHVLHGFAYFFLIEVKYLAMKRFGSETVNPPDAERDPGP
jgi:glycosyltransferase involved in cell wall biosynthesis